jgi:hypothetical protein
MRYKSKNIGVMRTTVAIIILFFCSSNVFSQTFMGVNIGSKAHIFGPARAYFPGVGGTFALEFFNASSTSFGGYAGYYLHFKKVQNPTVNNDSLKYSSTMGVIPIAFTVHKYFSESKFKTFVGGELAYHYYIYEYERYRISDGSIKESYSVVNGKLAVSPKAGVKIAILGNLHLGMEAKLDLIFTTSSASSYKDFVDNIFMPQLTGNIGLYYLFIPK